jgi:dTDP-4-amino-4,6-dideoxygalactose transaminase
MKKIQMVDLLGQYEQIQEEVDKAVIDVIRSAAFIKGPDVKLLEEELADYLNVGHVVACGNGTDALQIALMAAGLQPGDEVITPSFTFIATVEVISLLGLTPIMVDVEPDTFNIDPKAIEAKITDKTKAIIPVHLYGQCANMNVIMDLAAKHQLIIVEDSAQAISANYNLANGTNKKAGTIGNMGCTSFFPSKNLGCYGDGGAIFTDDAELAKKARIIANHGMKVKYHHEVIGVNSRLDTMQAAILRIKLRKLDEYKNARNKAAAYYDNAFANCDQLTTPFRNPESDHAFHQYTLITNGIDRDDLKEYLSSKEIPAMVYYPVPLHKQEAFRTSNYIEPDLPVTDDLCSRVISLPIHTEMTEDQLEYITKTILSFIGKH